MADYIEKLKIDLVEQFKEQPVITALIEVLGAQLNEVAAFYDELNNLRDIQNAQGKQLDGIGDIAVLTRKDAGELSCVKQSNFVIEDDDYRNYLLYKIWKNTCGCTYPDIMKSIRMFYTQPLYYRESIDNPAAILFETEELAPEDDTSSLMRMPLIKAGGVGINIKVNVATPTTETNLYTYCCEPVTMTITHLKQTEHVPMKLKLARYHAAVTPISIQCLAIPELGSGD